MIEIVFSDSACGSLKVAQHFGEGKYQDGCIGVFISHTDGSKPTKEEIEAAQREAKEKARLVWKNATPLGGNTADIYGFNLVLSVGDISENQPDIKRKQTLENLYSVYPNDAGLQAAPEILKRVNENLKTVWERAAAGESLRIWYSNQPDDLGRLLHGKDEMLELRTHLALPCQAAVLLCDGRRDHCRELRLVRRAKAAVPHKAVRDGGSQLLRCCQAPERIVADRHGVNDGVDLPAGKQACERRLQVLCTADLDNLRTGCGRTACIPRADVPDLLYLRMSANDDRHMRQCSPGGPNAGSEPSGVKQTTASIANRIENCARKRIFFLFSCNSVTIISSPSIPMPGHSIKISGIPFSE